MKLRHSIWIIVLIVTSLACGSLKSGQENGASTSPTSTPSQEFQEVAYPTPTAGLNAAGPMTLELDDRDLAGAYTASVVQHFVTSYSGVDAAGSSLVVLSTVDYIEQLQPGIYVWKFSESTRNGDALEIEGWAVIGDQRYTASGPGCAVEPDTQNRQPLEQQRDMLKMLTGAVQRAQTGVILEGVLADRYALGESNLSSISAMQAFISGSIYRAQEGGYLRRMDLSFTALPDAEDPRQKDFDPQAPLQVDVLFTQAYHPAGSLEPMLPAGCQQQGSTSSPGGVPQDIPLIPAEQILESFIASDMVSYNTDLPFQQVVEFYQERMVVNGWAAAEPSITAESAVLAFTKDSRRATVTITAATESSPTLVVVFYPAQ